MAVTQADIDALEAKINTFAGIQQTTFGDQSTTFDLEGGRKRLAEMKQQLRAQTTSTTRYAACRKGV